MSNVTDRALTGGVFSAAKTLLNDLTHLYYRNTTGTVCLYDPLTVLRLHVAACQPEPVGDTRLDYAGYNIQE